MDLISPHRRLSLERPVVMGVLNVTPDSFSDGGRFTDPAAAVDAASEMLDSGAAIIDIGAESTRPGSNPVGSDEQLSRLMPVLDTLRRATDAFLSIDTGDAAVIATVADAGADMINDVYALRQPGALEAVADHGLAVCLMHMQGRPSDMQRNPAYDDCVAEVREFLSARIGAALASGIRESGIAVDPGFGFGKTDAHNLQLLTGLGHIATLGRPVVAGLSRKSLLGRITGREPDERLAAGVVAAVLAVQSGARIVRTHDVPATVDALRMLAAAEANAGQFD